MLPFCHQTDYDAVMGLCQSLVRGVPPAALPQLPPLPIKAALNPRLARAKVCIQRAELARPELFRRHSGITGSGQYCQQAIPNPKPAERSETGSSGELDLLCIEGEF